MAGPLRENCRRDTRRRSIGKRLAAATLVLFLGLFIVELVLRVIEGSDGPFRVPDRWRHHALVPMRSRNERWGEARFTVSTNSLGMRDRTSALVPLARGNARRIVFLGDSFTEGIGVEFDETFPTLVEAGLRAAGGVAGGNSSGSIECLNSGLSSYSPLLEERTLRELLERGLEFDHLVLLVDSSDPQDELLYRRALGMDVGHMASATAEQDLFYSAAGIWAYRQFAVVRKLWRTSRHFEPRWIWRDSARRDRECWATDPELIQRWGNQGITLMQESLDRIVALARRRGVSLHMVIYPWPYQIEAGRATPQAPSIMEERLADYCSSRGVPLINLYPVFLAREDWRDLFVPGDVHWSPAGHRLVARAIAQELQLVPAPLRAADARPSVSAPAR